MIYIFEGINGCGKTTLAKFNAQHFGYTYLKMSTSTPDWSYVYKNNKDPRIIDDAFRLHQDFFTKVIAPVIETGKPVVLDRSFPSIYAYQCASPAQKILWHVNFSKMPRSLKHARLIYVETALDECVKRLRLRDGEQTPSMVQKLLERLQRYEEMRENGYFYKTVSGVDAPLRVVL